MEQVLKKFYSSFDNLDYNGMISCYHPEAQFSDPAFGTLNYDDIRLMWQMLCTSQSKENFKVNYYNINCVSNSCSADWKAIYLLSKTSKRVHNSIHSIFVFKDGLIYRQKDDFNLYHWAKQALGLKGVLLGWTPYFQRQLQERTISMLSRYKLKTINTQNAG
ncbi:MAG: hypothetical protein BM564_09290 [Bacteroidetes bacterium MedPE-SWsnd-G2]|mgnify:CR=1 FL=1|nr:MAG: hypothetical protein BM564_09290 [Bacteroidetes bacterium MedPE-SWsnd-G2]